MKQRFKIMTSDNQCIAIAEYCGYKRFTPKDGSDPYWRFRGVGKLHSLYALPRFDSDLNAMYYAEEVLLQKPELWDKYNCQLKCIAGLSLVLHAPALDRAEAFLKTVGLW